MITFGYKSKFSSIMRACAATCLGLIMLSASDEIGATTTIVKIVAALLFGAGVVTFLRGYVKRENGSMGITSFSSVVDMILGVLLFFSPASVADFIPHLIGFALIVFAILQFVVIFSTMSIVGSGGYSIVLTSLALLGGIYLLCSSGAVKFLSGIALVIYGASELLTMYRVSKAQESQNAQQTTYETSSTSDGEEASQTYTAYGPSSSSAPGKLDTSGIADAKEVDFVEEQ